MNRREFMARSAGGIGLIGASPGTPAAALRAGFCERDITPDLGMEQPGGYGKSYLREFHDPCKVRAAVIESGARKLAVVGVDALTVPREVVLAARRTIEARCGIPPEAVLVGASHSHSSGPVAMVQPGEYDHASEFVRKLAYEHSSCADATYLERVTDEIVTAVCHAHSFRAASRCSFGAGAEGTVAFNRRFRMKNGLEWTHPGRGNPDIAGAAGPIDPQVGVIGDWNGEGGLAGCIVNFTCHATTGPEGISANWIYYLEKTIRGVFGPDVVVVFLQGFSGDVTQFDNLSRSKEPSPDGFARLIGCSVGAEAVKVLVRAQPGAEVPLNAASRVLELSRRRPSAERLRRAMDVVRRPQSEAGHTQWTFAKETVLADALAGHAPTVQAEVQALQIGPALLLAAPGEMFCELGARMKRQSAFPLTFAVELANGSIGYVTGEEALGPHGGGYEARLTSYTNVEAAAGTKLIEAAMGLAASWTPGRVPQPESAPPFNPKGEGIGSEAWSYGNVPPELN